MAELGTVSGIDLDALMKSGRFTSSASLNAREPVVFHYTTASGALGILKSAEMWCTLAYHMNDSQECLYAHEVVKEVAREKLEKTDIRFRDGLLSYLDSGLTQIRRVHIFISCFSEAEDLLSQWRGYAHPSGYNLGFSIKILSILAKRQNFEFSRVIYDRGEQKTFFSAVVDSMIAQYVAIGGPDAEKNEISKALWPSISDICSKSAIVKHSAFSEEREWRLHSNPIASTDAKFDFISRRDELVPIFRMDLANGELVQGGRSTRDIAIRSYHCGPGGNMNEREAAIGNVFSRYRIHWATGGRSVAPLR